MRSLPCSLRRTLRTRLSNPQAFHTPSSSWVGSFPSRSSISATERYLSGSAGQLRSVVSRRGRQVSGTKFGALHCRPSSRFSHTTSRTTPPPNRYRRLAVIASVVTIALAVSALAPVPPTLGHPVQESQSAVIEEEMAVEIPPGRPGNLTPDQEEKLRRLWALVFQVCGVEDENAKAGNPPSQTRQDADLGKAEKPKKKRISFFSRRAKADTDSESVASVPSSGAVTPIKDIVDTDDKYGQTKHFFDTLASQSPQSIRATIWNMVKHDHPDALVLRFLRARKWDVEKALVMLVSTMNWRAKEMHVDDDIMVKGEAAAVEAENSDDPATRKLGHDFLAQIRMGKSFLHGIDRSGRPICVVRVRLHRQGEQAEESLERYTVYIIETARMLLMPPVDTATIVFDMTDFSRANMDYTPVRFMIKCFEANYPESLGTVLVHKAPWIFQGIWKIIKGWLDPVVASKVHFTNNMQDMEEFIAPKQLLKELDGQEDWDYQYVEPVPGENDKMKDTEVRDRLLREREKLYKEYENATMDWIRDPDGEKALEIKSRRNAIAARLREDYWNLDPYVRARSLYDRVGVLQPGGKLEYYSAVEEHKGTEAEEPEKVNGSVPETSADDVD